MLILCKILHFERMFGNEGDGFLHACISSYLLFLAAGHLLFKSPARVCKFVERQIKCFLFLDEKTYA